MSCGRMPKGVFADLKQTWTRQSSLNGDDWDPYPELVTNPSCYAGMPVKYPGVTEMYQGRTCMGCGEYPEKAIAYTSDANIGPHATQIVRFREGYTGGTDVPCCGLMKYMNLGKTWESQKPYNL